MIYCNKIHNYVDQEKKCIKCPYYNYNEDSCEMEENE